ncbi:MAG: hypothetical protein HY211_07550 [Candidatus Omnitrophica bacterium]|nr:hypothetical protein [Candidatus Omnitrophota bacterium]
MKGLSRFLVFAALAAFLLASFLSVLPHSHPAGMKGHDCLICRAQSVQPLVAPPVPLGGAPSSFSGKIVFAAQPLLSEPAFLSPSSRAPPLPV